MMEIAMIGKASGPLPAVLALLDLSLRLSGSAGQNALLLDLFLLTADGLPGNRIDCPTVTEQGTNQSQDYASIMLEVGMLPAASADEATLVDALCQVVNEAYEVAEAEIWRQTYPRTSVGEMSTALRGEHVAAACLSGRLVGSVFLRKLDSETGCRASLGILRRSRRANTVKNGLSDV